MNLHALQIPFPLQSCKSSCPEFLKLPYQRYVYLIRTIRTDPRESDGFQCLNTCVSSQYFPLSAPLRIASSGVQFFSFWVEGPLIIQITPTQQ